MPDTLEVPPFLIGFDASAVVFRFDPDGLELGDEYPPNLEALIADVVAQHAEEFATREVVIDLEPLPAISSKQLGAMLAVRRGCRQDSKVRLRNPRSNVRELLIITKLGDFFTWDK